MKTFITAAMLLTLTIFPAQALTCKLDKASRPGALADLDVGYSPETGWTVVLHGPNGEIWDWRDTTIMKNVDGMQWRGTPTARYLPRFEGWQRVGQLYPGKDGVMNTRSKPTTRGIG